MSTAEDRKYLEAARDLLEVARAARVLLDEQNGPAKDAGERHAQALERLRDAVEKPSVVLVLSDL